VTRTIAYEGKAKWQVYAGGYTDMVNQRGHGVKTRTQSDSTADTSATKTAKSEGASTASAQKSGRKLSYKHTYRLEKLPGEMEKCAADIATLETRLSDPDLFRTDPEMFNKLAAELEAMQNGLSALEDEWLELEALKEGAA